MAVSFAPSVLDLERITVLRRTVRSRLRNPDVTVGVGVALLCTVVLALGISHYPALAGDEGIYVEQTWSVLHGSIVPYTYTYDHPFLGWVQIAPLVGVAEWLHVGGPLSVVAGRAVMVLYGFVTLLLTYVLARRLQFRIPYAALAVLMVGFCPLFLVDARQVYLDNIAVPWVLGAFCLALTPRRRQWTYVAAALVFAGGVLSKETVVLFLPALAYLVWTRAYRPIRAMSMTAFVVVGTLAVGVYPLFAALRNELLPGRNHVSLWSNGVMYQLASRKGSGALWQAGSARHRLLADWLGWDRWLLLGGALACVIAMLAVARLRPIAFCFLLWALPVIKPGGYLPAMYVIAVLPFCGLLVAGCLDAAHERLVWPTRVRHSRTIAAAVTALSVLVVALLYAPNVERVVSPHLDTGRVTVAAERYVQAHAPHNDNLVVDDTYWTDLVRAGYGQPWHGVISYYKFDLDEVTSTKQLPHGWRDIDYIVSTPEMRANLVIGLGLPRLSEAMDHSAVVASFGHGQDLVQVRRVAPTPFNHVAGEGR